MKTLELAKSHKNITRRLAAQPETFYDGDSWAGRVYRMSPHNARQRTRILKALAAGPQCALSDADCRYLYAVLAQSYRRPREEMGMYGYYETYYRLDARDPVWRRIVKIFEAAGITRVPPYTRAWSD